MPEISQRTIDHLSVCSVRLKIALDGYPEPGHVEPEQSTPSQICDRAAERMEQAEHETRLVSKSLDELGYEVALMCQALREGVDKGALPPVDQSIADAIRLLVSEVVRLRTLDQPAGLGLTRARAERIRAEYEAMMEALGMRAASSAGVEREFAARLAELP